MDRCRSPPGLLMTLVLFWTATETQQQDLTQRHFRKGIKVDAAAVVDPLKVVWSGVSNRFMCSSYCVQRKCECASFSFVNGSCHMSANILSGPPGNDVRFEKLTECSAAKVLPHTSLVANSGCSATYDCVFGYIPQTSDSSTLTCAADETWSPTGFRCDLIPCTSPSSHPNADVTVNTYTVGGIAQYTCWTDYTNRGGNSDYKVCVLGGTWSNVINLLCEPTYVGYEIVIVTGTTEGGGTDADVHVIMVGSYASIEIVFYFNDGYSFEVGATDSKSGTCLNMGTLEYIRVEHTNTGSAPEWLVDTVTIYINGVEYFFSVDTWINTSPYSITLYV